MLRRAAWPFDFVLLVCCAFVFLTLGAMALYPGGTDFNSRATTYHFFENFFSDLGRTITKGSHRPNPFGSTLFFVALSSAGIALGVFFIAFARFFWGDLAQRVATTAGVLFGLLSALNFLGIAWYRANIYPKEHVHCVFAAFKCFPLAVFCFGITMLIGRNYPKRGAWIFAIFFVVLLVYLGLITKGPSPESAQGLMIQAVGQKIVVYTSLLCVSAQSLLARRHLSATMKSNSLP
ncbi:hypothetical protein IAD21_01473 [Abditibacteriota bacterium]|nr:hypothetical protein IAD21_01473 [Abditibacteriota bacterium]